MESHETLQKLRREKGLTQQELAERLFVSRTAVSKWESGRGYPNIDSLKALAACFSVTVDQLLSGDRLLSIAEEERQQTRRIFRGTVFGSLDCAVLMLLFLPLCGEHTEGSLFAVSLLAMTTIRPWIKAIHFTAIGVTVFFGIFFLVLQNCGSDFGTRVKEPLSMLLNTVGALLFIACRQPYAAALLFLFLAVKAFAVMKLQ